MQPGAGNIVRLLFLLIGVVAVAVGVRQMAMTASLLRNGVTTVGIVPAASDPTATLSHPSVTFTTSAGVVVRYRQNGYSATRGRTHVDVIYDPSDPEGSANVRSFSTLWLPVVLPLTLGLAALGLVGASLLMGWRVAQ